MVGGVIGNNNNNMSQPLPPCTRILAMNMIGDLMRKVGVSIYNISRIFSLLHTYSFLSLKHGLKFFRVFPYLYTHNVNYIFYI